ncbi:family protein CrcB [Bifidobacterium hapali]|uniref:Fluoride-specific ion channel FluC n=1 Tax=Bifidobacterium hapali TaxID=1630172 RepID=A0A261G092_9BIFI|nr:CrcB family protein [Bifidobacterium hapali]OZG64817.1 family protein CrcB [Bifidobacterium hapali]
MTDDDLPSLEMPILKQMTSADNAAPSAMPSSTGEDTGSSGEVSAGDGSVPSSASLESSESSEDTIESAAAAQSSAAAAPVAAAPAAPAQPAAEASPTTMEFASTRVNASSGHPIAAILSKGQPAPPQIPLAPMKRMQARFNPLADGMLYLVVFLGGFVGTGIRYGLGLLLPAPLAVDGFFHAFHPATFIANMCACFIFAALSAYMSQASWIRKRVRQLTSRGVGMGMCGGFSTLSAMAIEDLTSVQHGQIAGFVAYTLLSFACGLIVAWLGTQLALRTAAKRSVKALHEQVAAGDGSYVERSTAPRGDYGQPITNVNDDNIGIQPQAEVRASGGSGAARSIQSTTDSHGAAANGVTEVALVPAFEPDPVTDEIPMVADPVRGEAHAQ